MKPLMMVWYLVVVCTIVYVLCVDARHKPTRPHLRKRIVIVVVLLQVGHARPTAYLYTHNIVQFLPELSPCSIPHQPVEFRSWTTHPCPAGRCPIRVHIRPCPAATTTSLVAWKKALRRMWNSAEEKHGSRSEIHVLYLIHHRLFLTSVESTIVQGTEVGIGSAMCRLRAITINVADCVCDTKPVLPVGSP